MQTRIRITGMSCEHCVQRVTKALEGVKGIKKVRVNLQSGEAVFERPESVSLEEIRKAIEGAGYGATM